MMYLLLVVGFVLLIKGADFFVDGSSSVAKKLKIPSIIIGMTIVAMGTSLPETSVSVNASLAGKNDLAISNAIGSNIFNLLVVTGLCAILCHIPIEKVTLTRDIPFSALMAGLLIAMGSFNREINHLDGVILLAMFAFFLFMMVNSAKKARSSAEASEEEDEIKLLPTPLCIIYIIGGIAAIAIGGDLVVKSASDIARHFGMSDNLIGMTIVALGTSLPELVTSIVAAKKNEIGMALGNVIGSNIFNLLFVLGIAAAISPIGFTSQNMFDTAFLIASTILVLIFCIPKRELVRWHGIVMFLLYSGFAAYLFVR